MSSQKFIWPTDEEQLEQIEANENVLLESLNNAFLLLQPPADPNAQFFPHRVFLNNIVTKINILFPTAYSKIYVDKVLIGVARNQVAATQGPAIKVGVDGNSKKWILGSTKIQAEFGSQLADIRNFTSPGNTGDPATAGDLRQFVDAKPFKVVNEPDDTLEITIEGFDGTDPEFVDIALLCRGVRNQRVEGEFWRG